MHNLKWSWVAALVLSLSTGCGKSNPPDAQVNGPRALPADSDKPEKAVATFLEAARRGDKQDTNRMLTSLARKANAEHNIMASPPGSPTASFEITEVEYVTAEKDGAYVGSVWYELDENGKPVPDRFVWVVRKDDEGWRIAGLVKKIFEDAEPIVFRFEDPDDMEYQQQLLKQEIIRREVLATQQATKPENPAEVPGTQFK